MRKGERVMVHLGWMKDIITWSNELGQWATMMWNNTPESAKKALAKSWGGFGSKDNSTFQFHVLPLLSVKQQKAIVDLLHVINQDDRAHLVKMTEDAVLEKKVEKDLNDGKKDKSGKPLPPKKVTETTPDFAGAAKGLKRIADMVIAYQDDGGADLRDWVYAQHLGGGLFDQKTFKEQVSAIFGVVTGFMQAHGPVVVQIVGDGTEQVLSEFERLLQQAQLAEQVRQSRARRSWFNFPGRIIQRLFNI